MSTLCIHHGHSSMAKTSSWDRTYPMSCSKDEAGTRFKPRPLWIKIRSAFYHVRLSQGLMAMESVGDRGAAGLACHQHGWGPPSSHHAVLLWQDLYHLLFLWVSAPYPLSTHHCAWWIFNICLPTVCSQRSAISHLWWEEAGGREP